jgi:hypothetical protein
VRETGVEPARPFGHKILSLARLPVPPLPQVVALFYRLENFRSTAILSGIFNPMAPKAQTMGLDSSPRSAHNTQV